MWLRLNIISFVSMNLMAVLRDSIKKKCSCDIKGQALLNFSIEFSGLDSFTTPCSFWATLVNTNRMIEKGITGEALEMSFRLNHGHNCDRAIFMLAICWWKIIAHNEKRRTISGLYRMYHLNGLVRCHWFEPVEQDIYYAHEAYKGNLQTENSNLPVTVILLLWQPSWMLQCSFGNAGWSRGGNCLASRMVTSMVWNRLSVSNRY